MKYIVFYLPFGARFKTAPTTGIVTGYTGVISGIVSAVWSLWHTRARWEIVTLPSWSFITWNVENRDSGM